MSNDGVGVSLPSSVKLSDSPLHLLTENRGLRKVNGIASKIPDPERVLTNVQHITLKDRSITVVLQNHSRSRNLKGVFRTYVRTTPPANGIFLSVLGGIFVLRLEIQKHESDAIDVEQGIRLGGQIEGRVVEAGLPAIGVVGSQNDLDVGIFDGQPLNEVRQLLVDDIAHVQGQLTIERPRTRMIEIGPAQHRLTRTLRQRAGMPTPPFSRSWLVMPAVMRAVLDPGLHEVNGTESQRLHSSSLRSPQ